MQTPAFFWGWILTLITQPETMEKNWIGLIPTEATALERYCSFNRSRFLPASVAEVQCFDPHLGLLIAGGFVKKAWAGSYVEAVPPCVEGQKGL